MNVWVYLISIDLRFCCVNFFMILQEELGFELRGGGLRTILGQFDGKLLDSADRVVVSPGVSLENYGLSYLGNLVSRL